MSPDAARRPGLLVAIVGPSGAGKDTVTRLALAAIGDRAPRLRLARRVVTRHADCASEDHDSLDETAFREAETAGAFCLSWRANGLAYGIPAGVQQEVEEGCLIVANLSRRSLGDAARRFPCLAVVEISARPDLLLARITARGRESASEIAARLARNVPLEAPESAIGLLRIDNSGAAETAAAELRDHLLDLHDRIERAGLETTRLDPAFEQTDRTP